MPTCHDVMATPASILYADLSALTPVFREANHTAATGPILQVGHIKMVQVENPMLNGKQRRHRAVSDAELSVNFFHVTINGIHADGQDVRDHLVALTHGKGLQHLPLTWRQRQLA